MLGPLLALSFYHPVDSNLDHWLGSRPLQPPSSIEPSCLLESFETTISEIPSSILWLSFCGIVKWSKNCFIFKNFQKSFSPFRKLRSEVDLTLIVRNVTGIVVVFVVVVIIVDDVVGIRADDAARRPDLGSGKLLLDVVCKKIPALNVFYFFKSVLFKKLNQLFWTSA